MLELGFSIVMDCRAEPLPAEECEIWRVAWHEFWGETWNPGALLSHLAILADSMHESDYSAATKEAREMVLSQAEQRMISLGQQMGVAPDLSLGDLERFVDICVRTRIAAYETQGLDWNPELHFAEQIPTQYSMLARILADGDRHVAFWQLMDDYYHRFYAPWQKTRLEAMTWLETATINRLGGPQGSSLPSDISWLRPGHPLRAILSTPSTKDYQAYPVFFWIDPFDLIGAVSVQPGVIAVSCSTHIDAEEENRQIAQHVAMQMKALGDPTRLTILQMIRHFGMDNTATADLLGVSRPTVSNHVMVLQEAGLVTTHLVGRSARHHINSEEVLKAVKELLKFLDVCEPGREPERD